MLDDARIRSGIPLGQQFGLRVAPSLQPVLVVNADAAPLPSIFGQCLVAVGAAVGFRTELVVSGQVQDRNSVIEVFITLVPSTAAGQSYEVLLGLLVAGATRLPTPVSDNRRGQLGATGWLADSPSVFVGFKNTAAATAGGIRQGNQLFVVAPLRLGPYYIDNGLAGTGVGTSHICVRPVADNTGAQCLVEWRALQRQPS